MKKFSTARLNDFCIGASSRKRAEIAKFRKIPWRGRVFLSHPFQVIIPSGAQCSQAEKRPSGDSAE